ncbi:MAG TPA: hypothetical protein ENI95_11255 [Chloroflexi bacterium]|nr:hypothetical protein [Chloroflexota bacterium]
MKEWYARPGDQLEAAVEGFVIDIVRGDLLIEIQTANFSALRRKLTALTEGHAVRLVHPIAREKWIVRLDAGGRPVSRRRSPRRGRVEDLFNELVHLPTLITRPTFSLEILLIQAEQVLQDDGQGSWRRRGWSVVDHRLLNVVDQALFESPEDLLALLPPALPHPFTNRDLAEALGVRLRLAQKMTYCLRKMGTVEVVGRQGKAFLFTLLTG